MTVTGVRAELVATLEETLRLMQRLASAARDPGVPVADLVAQISVLERLDDERDELISGLRREASHGVRAASPGATVRESVLAALGRLRWPQNAGFVEQYLWATRQIQVDSRAFAPLRRDEQRAWERSRRPGRAHVAPAINPDGTANPRWLTSSAWELPRRVVASAQTERLFDLQKILALAGRPGGADDRERPRGPLDALLERYAEQVLDMAPPPVSAPADQAAAWRSSARRQASNEIRAIRGEDEARREEIAARLAALPEHDRVWGRRRPSPP